MKQLEKMSPTNFVLAVLLLPITFFISVSFATENNPIIGSVSGIISQVSTYGAYETYQKLMGNTKENLNGSNIIKLSEEITSFNGSMLKTSDWSLSRYKEQSNTFSIQANGHFGYKLRLLGRPELAPYVCNGSLESSGKRLWRISDLLLVSEEWSCGTLGCNYEISFINRNVPEKEYINLCKG